MARESLARRYKNHAIKRAEQRFDLHLSNSKRKKIIELIRNGQARCIGKGNEPLRKVYLLKFEDKKMRAVYDHYEHRLVTIMKTREQEQMDKMRKCRFTFFKGGFSCRLAG